MEIQQIISLIEKKISEHSLEMHGSEGKIQSIQESCKKSKPNLQDLHKLAIMKDKTLFHKACISVLEDLKNEIERTQLPTSNVDR